MTDGQVTVIVRGSPGRRRSDKTGTGAANRYGAGMECTHERQQEMLRLDLEGEQLWRGVEALRLRPKSFAVLRYLVAHAGRVVRKEELMRAIWPDTAISDGMLNASKR